jgi:hypothetical protein
MTIALRSIASVPRVKTAAYARLRVVPPDHVYTYRVLEGVYFDGPYPYNSMRA